jgi:hypothetical protein
METEEQKAERLSAEAEADTTVIEKEPELDDDGNVIELVETPVWMNEDDTDQTVVDPSKQVPVGKFVHLKKKLNGELSEKDKEIDRLRAERDDLRKSAPAKPAVLVRPKSADFGTDEEYDLAVSRYDEDRLQDTYNRNRLKETQDEQNQKAIAVIESDLDAHVERVSELVEKHGISKEKIDIAHDNFSKAMEAAFPEKQGNATKILISKLGPGSETVVISHGLNKAKREHLISLAKSDSTGLKLAVYLGEQKQILNNPIKPQSKAPDPTKGLNGDENTSITGAESKMKKAYQKIGAGTTESYNIKKKGKAAGYDVSKW